MKILLFSIVLLAFAMRTISQSTPSTLSLDLLEKSRKQKNTAWVLATCGTTLIVIGGVIALSDFGNGLRSLSSSPNEQPAKDHLGLVKTFIISGGLILLGSLPLFFASSRNHRSALLLSFRNENFIVPQKNSFVYKTIPSLLVKIPL
jgi:uncharacterized membrane protein